MLEFGPDGFLCAPVGAPSDLCRTAGYHGTVIRIRPGGSGIEVYARGIRSSLGLAWHPVTGELWFTDNGNEGLGADLPTTGIIASTAAASIDVRKSIGAESVLRQGRTT